MNERLLEQTLAAIEEDMTYEAGELFLGAIVGYLSRAKRGEGPISTALGPDELDARFRGPPSSMGRPLGEVVERLARDVLSDSLRLTHPMYMGPPVPPGLPATVWTEALVGALNQSTRAFAMSPTGTVIETRLVRWMAEKAGYGEGSGGSFTSGGTESNFTALLAARAACMPSSWKEGVGAQPPVVLCAENAHYTVFRAVAQLGLGLRQALTVPLRDFRLDTGALAARLEALAREGRTVMAVVSTAGAFGTGAFDDLAAIGALCERYGVWHHVDASHGGTALLSEAHRHRLRGIEKADSIAWDPHKTMLIPLSAGVLLVKDERRLEDAFTPEPGQGPHVRRWDQFKRTFMASRRVDALKVWVALERYGAEGLGALYEHLCRLTQVLHDAILARGDFEAFHPPDCNILSFRYIGDGSLGDDALDALNKQMQKRFIQSDRGWITSALIHGRYAQRVTMMNPLAREEHVHALLDGLAEVARQLLAEGQLAPLVQAS